jgi:hypothetical protein
VEIEATLRLPVAGSVTLAVNDQLIGSLEATRKWTRKNLRIDHEKLHRGLNRLTLRWPLPTTDGAAALREAAGRLELGIAADPHPVFGEVFSMMARARSHCP